MRFFLFSFCLFFPRASGVVSGLPGSVRCVRPPSQKQKEPFLFISVFFFPLLRSFCRCYLPPVASCLGLLTVPAPTSYFCSFGRFSSIRARLEPSRCLIFYTTLSASGAPVHVFEVCFCLKVIPSFSFVLTSLHCSFSVPPFDVRATFLFACPWLFFRCIPNIVRPSFLLWLQLFFSRGFFLPLEHPSAQIWRVAFFNLVLEIESALHFPLFHHGYFGGAPSVLHIRPSLTS